MRERKPFDSLTMRYLQAARMCRARDLAHLSVLSELVKGISELIHALQKERGASSIYLGSNGTNFKEQLTARVSDSTSLGALVREQLERLDEKLEPMSCSARFYARVAFAFRGLDSLPSLREQVAALTLAPRDAVKRFTEVIALLLAVGFEAADLAADPDTSRALVALVNFAQGKEYAGQERASAGAGLSRGELTDTDRRHLQRLVIAQDRAFSVFAEFADPIHVAQLQSLAGDSVSDELNRLRAATFEAAHDGTAREVSADAWYEVTTQRIDALRRIEANLATDVERLCVLKLAEARAEASRADTAAPAELKSTASFAMLVTEVDPNSNDFGDSEGVRLYGLDRDLPKPMRSILNVVEAQSRRIDDINSQLESARVALTERKTIERARGILMRSRRLSEEDAYDLMRRTAMGQNKRIVDIAEAIISMADMFKG